MSNMVAQVENSKTSFPVDPVVKTGPLTARQSENGDDVFQQNDATTARPLSLSRPLSLPSLAVKPEMPRKRQTRSCLANSLFHSVYKCRIQKTKFLLEKGLIVNSKNDYGYNSLFAALQIENPVGRRRMLQLLLDYDVDPFECDPKYNRNTLHWAAKMGRNQEIGIIFDSYMGEFDFHQRDRDGMTPLHLATCSGHADVVRTLVKEMVRYGMTVDVNDCLGLTPYLHAKRMGYDDIAEILHTEGKASAGKADEFAFKKADEWREIGIKERSKNIMENQMSKAAIFGRLKLSSSDSASDTQSVTSNKRVAFVPESIIRKTAMEPGKCGKAVDFTLPSGSLESTKWRLSRLSKQAPSDVSRTDGYKLMTWDLEKLMDYWGQQHTRSFRNPVVPKVKFEEKVIEHRKKACKESRRSNKKGKTEK